MRKSVGSGRTGVNGVLVAATVLFGMTSVKPAGAVPLVIDFESVTPRNTDPLSYPQDESYWDPNPGFAVAGTLFSGGSYNGFVVSSSTTTGQAGYLYSGSEAEISAQSNGGAGGGAGGSSNFAVGYYGGPLFIDLPAGYRPASVSLTNTATAYAAILDGLNGGTPFKAGDWFRVRFTGYSAAGGTGSETGAPVDFYLADYRDGQTLVIDSWTALDLSPLGEAQSIVLSFTSTDNNPAVKPPFDLNTPAYVALDNLTLMAVPEPGAAGLAAAGVAWCLLGRCRRRAGRVTE